MNTQELRKLSDSEMLHVMPIASLRKAFTDAADKIDQLQAELGDLPESQNDMLKEIKRLKADIERYVDIASQSNIELAKAKDQLASRADIGTQQIAEDLAELRELRIKLAAMEKQEPIAYGWQDANGLIIDCIGPEPNPKYRGAFTTPLYLSAGAKE